MSNKTTEWENVKIRKQIADKIRSHKKKTGVSMMAFVELSVVERLKSIAKLKSPKHLK